MTTYAVVSQVVEVEVVVEQRVAGNAVHISLNPSPGQSQAPFTENVLTLADPIG